MRIQVSAIGRLKPGPERELASHYVMRAGASGRSLEITSIVVVEHAEIAGDHRAGAPGGGGRPAAFGIFRRCEAVRAGPGGPPAQQRGIRPNDPVRDRWRHPAARISHRRSGRALEDSVRESARGGILSLGRMTWPHRLARVMIAEQIYRAVTILINHPYHRGSVWRTVGTLPKHCCHPDLCIGRGRFRSAYGGGRRGGSEARADGRTRGCKPRA